MLSEKEVSQEAKALFTDDFYWSSSNEFAPFGSDSGWDAFHQFKDWRKNNGTESPLIFLKSLIGNWGYPAFELTELDENAIKEYKGSENPNIDMDRLKEHFKKEAEKEGREFNEEQFNQILNMTMSSMGSTYLLSIDNAIVAVGFGQYVLEGQIDKDLAELTRIALERELLPVILTDYQEGIRAERVHTLQLLLKDLKKMQ